MPTKECSLRRGKGGVGGTELPASPTGACSCPVGSALLKTHKRYRYMDTIVQLYNCTIVQGLLLIDKLNCKIVWKRDGLSDADHADSVDHCKMLIMLLLRCSHLPISMQPLLKVGSHGGAGEPHLQGLDIISTALQARSTEFSDFSRSPAYCPSCTEGKLEVGKFFPRKQTQQIAKILSVHGRLQYICLVLFHI